MATRAPDVTNQSPKPEHGRRERRSLWASGELNEYLDCSGVGQVFAVGRDTVEVKSGKRRCETAYGVTSLTSTAAAPERLLAVHRGHCAIDNEPPYYTIRRSATVGAGLSVSLSASV